MVEITTATIFNEMMTNTIKQLPNLLGTLGLGLVLVLFGWVLGKIVGKFVKEVLRKFRVDNYFKLGKRISLTEIISLAVSWIIYLAFIGSAVDVLEIETLTTFFDKILSFVASLLGGIVVLIVGYAIAGYIQKQVVASKTPYAGVISQVIFFFTLVIAIEMAFQVVGLPTQLLDSIILILVGSVGLGTAIAIGLGLKDVVAKLAKKYASKL